ncbi:MAG TPA: MFS transporter [Allocoleopsis sp.]
MKSFAKILLLISTAEVIASNLFPLYATYVQHIGGNLFDVGSTLALQSIVVGVGSILSSRIATKYKTEKLHLVLGYLISAFVFLAYPHITNPQQFYITQFVDGIGLSLVIPAFSGLYSSIQEAGQHTKGWGNYFGSANIAAGIALLASGSIAQHFGYNTLFYAVAAFEFLTVIMALCLFRLNLEQN